MPILQVEVPQFSGALAGDICQSKIDEIFQGLSKVFGIANDILIVGFDTGGKDHESAEISHADQKNLN